MFPYGSSSVLRSRSISSQSSSTFSTRNFTQSDTEAEEEKKFQKRSVHRREVLTPSTIMLDRRRKGMVASCSTPKSSQENLFCHFRPLDETSVYFRPRPSRRQWHGNKQRQRKGKSQHKQLQIDDYYNTIRRRNPYGRRRDLKETEKDRTPTQMRPLGLLRWHSNSMERTLLDYESDQRMRGTAETAREEKCSSPILLDFRRTSESEQLETVHPGGQLHHQILSPLPSAPSVTLSPFGRHYAVLRRIRMKRKMKREALPKTTADNDDLQQKQQYTNLPLGQIGGSSNNGDQSQNQIRQGGGDLRKVMNSNSDSGMEERLEEDDDRTQFVNISSLEKVYENLPPMAPIPLPPTSKIPPNPPPLAIVLPQQLVEDFPALYARLVALAFLDARNECLGGDFDSSAPLRKLQLAQKQICDLIGLRMGKSTELSTLADSDECFRRKCAEFCSQLAQKLRNTEAHSRKEFGWQTKKLQKVLHQLRTEGQNGGERVVEGTLHKLFRRIFGK